jgi:hypothetical protein
VNSESRESENCEAEKGRALDLVLPEQHEHEGQLYPYRAIISQANARRLRFFASRRGE